MRAAAAWLYRLLAAFLVVIGAIALPRSVKNPLELLIAAFVCAMIAGDVKPKIFTGILRVFAILAPIFGALGSVNEKSVSRGTRDASSTTRLANDGVSDHGSSDHDEVRNAAASDSMAPIGRLPPAPTDQGHHTPTRSGSGGKPPRRKAA